MTLPSTPGRRTAAWKRYRTAGFIFGVDWGAMSKTMLIGTLLFLGACGGSAGGPGTWQKAGATDATVAADTAQCRTTAQQTAARLSRLGTNTHPPAEGARGGGGAGGVVGGCDAPSAGVVGPAGGAGKGGRS